MVRTPLALLAVLILLATTAPAHAAGRDPDNAATWYRRAYELQDGLPEDLRNALANWDHTTAPNRLVRRIVRLYEPALEAAARGGRCRFCDFGLDFDQGWELLLPHLSQTRQIQRALAARAAVAMVDGRPHAAVQDILTMQRMGAHMAEDGLLISSLVGMAGLSLAEEVIDQGFRRGVFGPGEAGGLLMDTQEFAAPGTMRLRPSVEGERRISQSWLGRLLMEADDEQRRETLESIGVDPEGGEFDHFVSMSREELSGQLERLDAAYVAADVAFEQLADDPEEALETLKDWEARLEDGAFGELAMLFVPSFTRVMERGIEVREMMEGRESMLRDLIRGDDVVRLDAAVHVRAAIEATARLSEEVVLQLATGMPAIDAADDPEAVNVIRTALTDAVGHLTAAADANAFDEGVLLVEGDSLVLPSWLAGGRRALQLLAGAAAERLSAGDHVAAVRLAGVGLRVAHHVGAADSVGGFLLASEHVGRLQSVLEGLPSEIRADPEVRAGLVAAAEMLVLQPSFDEERRRWLARETALLGSLQSVGALRSLASQAAHDLRQRASGADPGWAEPDAEIDQTLDADGLAVLVLTTERVAGNITYALAPPVGDPGAKAGPATDRLPDVSGLDGLVDATAMAGLESRIAEIRRRVAERRDTVVDILGDQRTVLALERRMREAGRLIRAVQRTIDPDHRWGLGAGNVDDDAAG